jgi:hypothetical protein
VRCSDICDHALTTAAKKRFIQYTTTEVLIINIINETLGDRFGAAMDRSAQNQAMTRAVNAKKIALFTVRRPIHERGHAYRI